jgi:hypothetical protein
MMKFFILYFKAIKTILILALVIMSFSLTFSSIQLIQANTKDSNCNVEIIGGPNNGSPNMYPGQLADLRTNVSDDGSINKNYTWRVEAPIIKDYDDSVYNPTNLSASQNLEDPTNMSLSDFHKSDIQFYWQPNTTDTNRTVTVLIETPDGICQDSKHFTVEKSNDIDYQAEDFYVENNRSFGNRNVTSIVLKEHQNWHTNNTANGPDYNGTFFFEFHKLYLTHFDAWRKLFGYENITEWNPNTPIPRGIDIDHGNRLAAGVNYYPLLNESLPEFFKVQNGSDGPVDRPISLFNNGTDQDPNFITRPCEILSSPDNSSQFPKVQDALNDFEPNLELLGCALTSQYHNDIHVAVGQYILDEDEKILAFGDMRNARMAPQDPIFWRLHKFIDNVSVNRSQIDNESDADVIAVAVEDITTNDTKPPQVFSQNPFRVSHNNFITGLPLISEQEEDLFGITDVPSISVEFDEPVSGVMANDFKVNDSPATQVNGTGTGPYVFIGFESPAVGPVNVTLSPGNITDRAENKFEGASWNYVFVDPRHDDDKDGLMDDLEVDSLLTNPLLPDTDGDSMPDGFEVASTTCLDPLENDSQVMDIAEDIISTKGLDSDNDGVTNVLEFRQGKDPCSPPEPSLQIHQHMSDEDILSQVAPKTEDTTKPFALVIKMKSGLTEGHDSRLLYDSFTKEAISIVNGNETLRQISDSDEDVAKRTLNVSGFFDAESLYPPRPNSTGYLEFTAIATLNGKLHAIYWTDESEDVPDAIKNLPFILAYILGTARVF